VLFQCLRCALRIVESVPGRLPFLDTAVDEYDSRRDLMDAPPERRQVGLKDRTVSSAGGFPAGAEGINQQFEHGRDCGDTGRNERRCLRRQHESNEATYGAIVLA
jgi:hypothetical protein